MHIKILFYCERCPSKQMSKFLGDSYHIIFYVLLPVYGRDSTVLGSNFRNGDFDRFKYFEVSRIRKITFFCCWSLSLCVTSITPKQIISETNFLFYICIIHRWYSRLFIKIGQIIRIQGPAKEFENIMT